MNSIVLDGFSLSIDQAYKVSRFAADPKAKIKIEIAKAALDRIQKTENFVSKIVEKNEPVYGINTGFGKFAEVSIPRNDLELLQKNLILSHACGVGPELDRPTVFMMWLIRLNVFCRGHSGIKSSTLKHIVTTLEHGILACIPSRGSVGASGDLSPSAHASLALIGEGEVTAPIDGHFKKLSAHEALKHFKLEVLTLGAKEGLALINGTQLTTSLAAQIWKESKDLLSIANFSLALSIEGLRATHKFLDQRILAFRNQKGALVCGQQIVKFLGSETQVSLSHQKCGRIQDPYSLRCAPQVHGALWNDLEYLEKVISGDLNSSTDNPLLFSDEEESLSGGNFHAIYTAKACDQLASGLTTLSNISERRIALAMSPESSGLPAFLIKKGGLNSGLMMAHVTAAALVSENKSLCWPASVDSIPTSDDREDHVSMGPGAGFKAKQILENTRRVLAIEILTACQALNLLDPLKSSTPIEDFRNSIAKDIKPLDSDRPLYKDIQYLENKIQSSSFLDFIHKVCGA